MSASEIAIADAIKADLNDAEAFAFTAERVYVPLNKIEALSTLRVLVIPKSIETRNQARRRDLAKDIQIDVGILRRINADPQSEAANAELDPLSLLAEQLVDFYNADDTAGPSAVGKWLTTERPALYDQERLLATKTFVTVITFTFKVL